LVTEISCLCAVVALIYNGKSADRATRLDWLRVTPQNGNQ
jgi:hypothetical protein